MYHIISFKFSKYLIRISAERIEMKNLITRWQWARSPAGAGLGGLRNPLHHPSRASLAPLQPPARPPPTPGVLPLQTPDIPPRYSGVGAHRGLKPIAF